MEVTMTVYEKDDQLVSAATEFVDAIVEEAQAETLKRRKEASLATAHSETDRDSTRKRGRWHSRARGFLLRTLSALCLCNSAGGGKLS